MDILKKLMQEAKDQYHETMRDMTICQIIAIKCENICNEDLFATSSYKKETEYPSRTIFSTKFFRNRCIVAKQYFLSHRLIKNIIIKAYLLLPEIFCDIGHHRSLEFIDLDKYINT